mmetsp:Transcript_1651/g.3120  ORF Transcript_1651/g.3120 Transcript_1651/m.3120 type:complete len:92 (+) Transcript_1651:2098-2373(+)
MLVLRVVFAVQYRKTNRHLLAEIDLVRDRRWAKTWQAGDEIEGVWHGYHTRRLCDGPNTRCSKAGSFRTLVGAQLLDNSSTTLSVKLVMSG